MLAGIDEGTVDFEPSYDASDQEPVVLPSRFPNLLVNGNQGIAVGMATNIPPHNLGEICDAAVMLIERPETTLDALMKVVRGPDFPTGALIMGERRHRRRVPHRSGFDPAARGHEHRVVAARPGDRRHRDPVPDERRR